MIAASLMQATIFTATPPRRRQQVSMSMPQTRVDCRLSARQETLIHSP